MSFEAIAPIIGAGIGAISGGKGSTSTVSNRPYIPPNYQKGYDQLLEDALAQYKKNYTPTPTTRAEPSSAFNGLFNNPELQQIQQQSDKSYFDSLTTPPPAADPNAASASDIDALRGQMLVHNMVQGSPGMVSTSVGRPWQEFESHATPADFSGIGKKLNGATQFTGGNVGGFSDPKNGGFIDLGEFLNKYRMGKPNG